MNIDWFYEQNWEVLNKEEILKIIERCVECPKCGSTNKNLDMETETLICKECGEIYG